MILSTVGFQLRAKPIHRALKQLSVPDTARCKSKGEDVKLKTSLNCNQSLQSLYMGIIGVGFTMYYMYSLSCFIVVPLIYLYVCMYGCIHAGDKFKEKCE